MADAGRPGNRVFPELASSWLPPYEMRRLAAYKVLAAYDNNQAGQLAAASGDEAAFERRELGDAAKLVDTALGYLLGSDQQIVVTGGEHADEEPPPPGAAEAAGAQERLRQWAEKELLPLRVQQAERNAVLLGDAVYVLAWDPDKGRPTLRTYDPGFYFPQWDDDQDQDYPTRVHLAWELPEDPEMGLKARVRRVTYELSPISEDGSVVRRYPWEPGRESSVTCFLTDPEWLLEDLKRGETVDRLPLDKATFRMRPDGTVLDRLDLLIDFVPVVHVPNTVPDAGEHWGRSVLAKVLQGLDELAATDLDSSAASATTGTPIIGLAGARLPVNRATGKPEQLKVEAGAVWQLGDTGRMDVLDTSSQLAELRARVEHLLDRVASNSRITPAGLGTLDATQVPSGYALKLALGPLHLRLTRQPRGESAGLSLCRFGLLQAVRLSGLLGGDLVGGDLLEGGHHLRIGDEGNQLRLGEGVALLQGHRCGVHLRGAVRQSPCLAVLRVHHHRNGVSFFLTGVGFPGPAPGAVRQGDGTAVGVVRGTCARTFHAAQFLQPDFRPQRCHRSVGTHQPEVGGTGAVLQRHARRQAAGQRRPHSSVRPVEVGMAVVVGRK
ncbi:hypothetical protein [Actinacidiphila acididurans]|uniref:Phage portal protein n=1 Tax=Actinacidiphila acididurans TaxID=2784346 RepID=A0ABS2TPK4_9ACTN|nr:hypothetical protein [Actinacidiphila acididurans]MBM9505274.1 hypothetical protein [Actinacidiphila acididurans]